jgi:diacylglycerol kinase family enzyme
MLSDLLGPGAERFAFDLTTSSGERVQDACLVMVSNNVYALEHLGGFGSRAHMDEGVLGVVALRVSGAADVARLTACELAGRVSAYSGFRQWTTPRLEVGAGADVAAGVDGESLRLAPPLRFEVLPGALVVRIPPTAPGRSPGAVAAEVQQTGIRGLMRVATGRSAGDTADAPASGSPAEGHER